MEREALDTLHTGPLAFFSYWPNTTIPAVAAGVYTIWQHATLVYVGMAGRSLSPTAVNDYRQTRKVTGLYQRLASHAHGRRSGDQFCVYVADRLVLPLLSAEQIAAIAAGQLSFDSLTRHFIHTYLAYRWVEVADGATARVLEDAIKRGALPGGPPVLNPHPGTRA